MLEGERVCEEKDEGCVRSVCVCVCVRRGVYVWEEGRGCVCVCGRDVKRECGRG